MGSPTNGVPSYVVLLCMPLRKECLFEKLFFSTSYEPFPLFGQRLPRLVLPPALLRSPLLPIGENVLSVGGVPLRE